jgi:hypothetical protein
MTQEIELELTFLAKELPKDIKTVKPTRIIDIYIPDTPQHSHLRLRQKGDKYEMTKKMPIAEGDASEQIEQTIPLTKDEFVALSSCSKKRVAKDRYEVKIEGKMAEIDVFIDELKGLVLIDFEFNTIDEKSAFKRPSVALVDVTQEDFIAGGLLAGKTYDDIAPELEHFNYRRVE